MILYVGDEEPAATENRGPPRESQLDIAWLLDEELVELRGSGERTRTPADVIGQDLRLPPGLNAVRLQSSRRPRANIARDPTIIPHHEERCPNWNPDSAQATTTTIKKAAAMAMPPNREMQAVWV
jgi:hypothetical protein